MIISINTIIITVVVITIIIIKKYDYRFCYYDYSLPSALALPMSWAHSTSSCTKTRRCLGWEPTDLLLRNLLKGFLGFRRCFQVYGV